MVLKKSGQFERAGHKKCTPMVIVKVFFGASYEYWTQEWQSSAIVRDLHLIMNDYGSRYLVFISWMQNIKLQ